MEKIKTAAHTERLTQLLDIAERLFHTEGFEKTSVNRLIEEAGIAKGTFYHYFKSKDELLDRLLNRLSERILAAMQEIVSSSKNAAEKCSLVFSSAANIKTDNPGAVLSYLENFYRDENAAARLKYAEKVGRVFSPLFAQVLKQGYEEGVFDNPYFEDTATVILKGNFSMSDEIAGLLLEYRKSDMKPEYILYKVEAYSEMLRRLIGVKKGLVQFINMEDFKKLLTAIKS